MKAEVLQGRKSAPVWALDRLQFLQEISICSSMEFLQGLQWNIRSTLVLSTGSRGISAPVPGEPPPSLSSSLTLVFALWFLSLFCSLLLCLSSIFWPFLNMFFSEAPPALLMDLAVSSGGSIWASGNRKSLPSSYRAGPSLQKPCHLHPFQWYFWLTKHWSEMISRKQEQDSMEFCHLWECHRTEIQTLNWMALGIPPCLLTWQ